MKWKIDRDMVYIEESLVCKVENKLNHKREREPKKIQLKLSLL